MASQDKEALALAFLALVLYKLYTSPRNPIWLAGEEEDDDEEDECEGFELFSPLKPGV